VTRGIWTFCCGNTPNRLNPSGAVISSLPLLNFPPDKADALAEKIRAILDHGGKWVQYSYHLGNGHHKSATRFRRLASKIIWLNLPPARVNVYQK